MEAITLTNQQQSELDKDYSNHLKLWWSQERRELISCYPDEKLIYQKINGILVTQKGVKFINKLSEAVEVQSGIALTVKEKANQLAKEYYKYLESKHF